MLRNKKLGGELIKSHPPGLSITTSVSDAGYIIDTIPHRLVTWLEARHIGVRVAEKNKSYRSPRDKNSPGLPRVRSTRGRSKGILNLRFTCPGAGFLVINFSLPLVHPIFDGCTKGSLPEPVVRDLWFRNFIYRAPVGAQ